MCDVIDKDVPSLLRKKKFLERTEEISTPDILRKFKVDRSDPESQYYFKPKYLYENAIASFTLMNDGVLYKETDIHFVNIPGGHNFLIKKIDGREVKADESDIEYIEEELPCNSLSYVEINRDEVNIPRVFIDRKGYGVDRLGEMLQEYVRLESKENKYDDLKEDDDGCINLEEEENKKVSDKDKKRYRQKRAKKYFDSNMDISED